MFESLKHWFENLPHADHLFEHPEAEQIHVALASVLYHVIAADQLESSNEKRFIRFLDRQSTERGMSRSL
jgi:uncharacterized tellurite resistance protein B-like protein